MAIAAPKSHMTLAEFERIPVGPPYYEFEEGEAILVSSPTLDHQDIADVMTDAIKRFAHRGNLGRAGREVDVYLPDGRVFIPDVFFVASDRLSLLLAADGKVHGAPDLVVEITSQDQSRDRSHKFRVYYANGVPWYWLIDGESLTIEEYHAGPEGYVLVSTTEAGKTFRPQLFPGLSINLARRLHSAPRAQGA